MASIQQRLARGGRQRYRVQIRLKGVLRSATFPTLQEARQWAAVTEGTLHTQRGTPRLEAVYHLTRLREGAPCSAPVLDRAAVASFHSWQPGQLPWPFRWPR